MGGELLGEQDLNLTGRRRRVGLGTLAGAAGEESGGDDPGVVEDEEVSGAEICRKVGEGVVLECACGAVDGEHATGSADRGRRLGDELFREVEVEVGDEHSR